MMQFQLKGRINITIFDISEITKMLNSLILQNSSNYFDERHF